MPSLSCARAAALFELATKANALAPIDCAPAPPDQKLFMPGYVNNATVSDVTFLVGGRKFHAHRLALLAASDTFRHPPKLPLCWSWTDHASSAPDQAQQAIESVELGDFNRLRFVSQGNV